MHMLGVISGVTKRGRRLLGVSIVLQDVASYFFITMDCVGGLKCCGHGEIYNMVRFEANNEL